MSERDKSKWCDDCGRMIGVGCACGLSFAEKMKMLGLHTKQWSDTSPKKD